MRRFVSLLPLVALILVAASPVWSSQPALENSSWTSVEDRAAEQRAGYDTFQKECEEAVKKIKTALQTYVHTVITVAKAVIKAIQTVLVSIAKLILRFALAVMLIIARWVISLVLPL